MFRRVQTCWFQRVGEVWATSFAFLCLFNDFLYVLCISYLLGQASVFLIQLFLIQAKKTIFLNQRRGVYVGGGGDCWETWAWAGGSGMVCDYGREVWLRCGCRLRVWVEKRVLHMAQSLPMVKSSSSLFFTKKYSPAEVGVAITPPT